MKSVSAFANGIGRKLIFGIDDSGEIVGIIDAQKSAEAISDLIKTRITPTPQFILTLEKEQEKSVLILTIEAGRATPYYYKADGIREAYVRIGNESIVAPDYILNELILKGKNQSFDALTKTILLFKFIFPHFMIFNLIYYYFKSFCLIFL